MVTQQPSECDVIVIGSGIAGLTAAALLAKTGLYVIVVEAEHRPGGYLAGFDRGSFIFDSSLHWLNQCQDGGFVYRIFSHIGADFPKCIPLTRIRRLKGDSYDYLLTNHPDDLRDRLVKEFPGDADGIHKLFADAKALGERVNKFNDLMRSRETMSMLEQGSYGLKMAWNGLFVLRHIVSSIDNKLNRYFKHTDIKKIFCCEEDMMSILMPIGWAYTGDFQVPPTGGSQAFINWLHKLIGLSGSEVLLNHRVEKVMLDGNRAIGVRLSSGDVIRSRYVLAACDVEALYEKMLPQGHIPADLLKRLRNADLYNSGVTLSIGLDCEAGLLGFNEELISIARGSVSREDHTCGNPHKTGISVFSPSFRDSSLAPEGKSTLTIHCPVRLDYADCWKTGDGMKRGAEYKAFKQEYANVLIDRVEEALALDLRSHIEVLDIATPVTYWRYTGNRGGSIMGARPTNKNIKSKIAHYRTPVQNLLLGGHWAEYGGGVPLAVKAGTNCTLLILREINKAAFMELRDVMDRRKGECLKRM